MGKGDRKTRRGKIIKGSNGVRRPKKNLKKYASKTISV
jgi:ribosomal small subunit protein bTHX